MTAAGLPRDTAISARFSMRLLGDLSVAVTLAVVLGGVYLVDSRTATEPPPLTELPNTADAEAPAAAPPPLPPSIVPKVDPMPRVVVQRRADGRFGLSCLTGNPDDPSDDGKRLTFSVDGATNNTRVMVDGRAPIFGDSDGQTIEPWQAGPNDTTTMTWSFRNVVVRQTLRLVAGDVSRRFDTIRVSYQLQNKGATTRQAGLRVMLDTLIGDNDGVPFIVPGREGIVTGPLTMRGTAVPDFVRSLERPILASPGVIVDLNLVPSEREERPSELLLTHWPGGDAGWNYDRSSPFTDDTAAGLYYAPAPLEPGRTREIGFSYGLGTISSTATRNARLSLTAGGPIRAGSSFWLVALVNNPGAGQAVRLALPVGLTPRRPASASQAVDGSGDYTQLSWLVDVAPGLLGDIQIEAALEPGGITERQSLNIQPPDAQLALMARGPFRSGRPFWVSALVRNPRAGQSVALGLPDGVTLSAGQSASTQVGARASGGYEQVNWLVVPGSRIDGRVEITARLLPDGVQSHTSIEIGAGDLIR